MLAELAVEFVGSLAHIGPLTRKGYGHRLSRTCGDWASMGCEDAGMLTAAFLMDWIRDRMERARWREVCTDMRLACRFLRWMARRGHLLSDPVPEWLLERFRFGRSPAPVPGERDVREFADMAGRAGGRNGLRNRAIVEVLYGCGLRCCELVGLDLAGWRVDELRVRGKFGAERVVPVGAVASAALRDYVDKERPAVLRRWNPHEPALFVGLHGRRMRTETVGAMFRGRLGHAFKAHQLRHACATHMLRNGASVVVLRDMLGHRSISTTTLYTEVKTEDVRKALDKFHPRG